MADDLVDSFQFKELCNHGVPVMGVVRITLTQFVAPEAWIKMLASYIH